ncbi:glycosyltransferase family 4 protein [Curtobacterium herbarum]|uniref:glycosyltransferase family 4 protein n=1 Tax=Curtobacterium herbarum TaxID=150122 RepID=UPI001C8DEDB0|nr:glycosyltransferase family 4 protein [Curtobacterium herbarum]MBY0176286.1 glycosyltransferase family 4 protein [Curtobacterium herbarum]
MKTLWIVNHYAHHAERDGRATRHQHLAAGLARLGWRTVVITAGTDHPTGRSHLRGGVRLRERWAGDGYEFCWLRGVDHQGSGPARTARRVADMVAFTALALTPGMLRGLPRPDVVLGGSFHPFAAWAGSALAQRYGVPFVFEPRDLWPESALGLAGMTERHPVIRLLRSVERRTVGRAKHIISPLEGVGRYYEARGHDVDFTWIPNGVDLTESATCETAAPSDSDEHGRPFTVTYIGSMGPANALEAVIDGFDLAWRRAQADGRPPIALRLVGDGSDVTRLRERAARLPSAPAIHWDGRVPQGEARRIGRQAGCLVVNMHDLDLYTHGVSMNKQFEYMLLGRPLLVGAPVPLEPVRASRSGIHVRPDDPTALADGILELAAMSPGTRAEMGDRGREYVRREHDYCVLAATVAGVLDAVTAQPQHDADDHAGGNRP